MLREVLHLLLSGNGSWDDGNGRVLLPVLEGSSVSSRDGRGGGEGCGKGEERQEGEEHLGDPRVVQGLLIEGEGNMLLIGAGEKRKEREEGVGVSV
jgi:hypothetical protein